MSWYPRQTVVVPVDFSDESLMAVAVGVDIAAQRDGVHVVHVLPELSPAEPVLLWEMYESEKRKQAADEELAKLVKAVDEVQKNNAKLGTVVVGVGGVEGADLEKIQSSNKLTSPLTVKSRSHFGVRSLNSLVASVTTSRRFAALSVM